MGSIDAMAVLHQLIENGVPRPNDDERTTADYRGYLTRMQVLDEEFRYGEIVNAQGDCQKPPHRVWPRMVLTLAAVQLLRELWGRQVKIIAAYRPGNVGASNSQHKTNRALDVDYYSDDPAELREWFLLATRFWCDHGPVLKMGFGLYTGGTRSLGGNRVHIDTGWVGRTWQGVYKQGFKKPWNVTGRAAQLSVKLAYDNGWDVPTREDI